MFLRGEINRLSKILTTICEGLSMLYYVFIISDVSIGYQLKYILTEASYISGKGFH